jgi:hypothetical protein
VAGLVRVGALAALTAAILTLGIAGQARAERPGWYSNPSIIGSAEVGAVLTASDGGLRCDPGCVPDGPDPSRPGIYFEWVSCPSATSGGSDAPAGGLPDQRRPCPGGVSRSGTPSKTATTYTVRPEDGGRWLQLHIVATNYDCGHPRSDGSVECRYSSAEGYSSTVGPIGGTATPPPPPPPPSAGPAGPPNLRSYPRTSGLAKEGETISSSPGSWTDSPTSFVYQWKRCAATFEPCSAIVGATGATYVLTADDVGSRVQVLVTASNAKGSNSAASFPTEIVATSAVAPANAAPPTITGIVEDRQTLTASPGMWTGTEPIGHAYQWLRCSTKLGGCAPIADANQATYLLTREDLGSRLVVTVTASNRGGTGTATSARTEHVVAAKPRPGADRLPVEEVDSPNRLRIASVRVAPAKLRPRGSATLTVLVTDRRGFLIEGADVRVAGRRGVTGGSTASDTSGVAVLRVRAGARLPRSVVLTVTASNPDDPGTAVTKTVRLAVATR